MTMLETVGQRFGWTRPGTLRRGVHAGRGALQRMDRTTPYLLAALGMLVAGVVLIGAQAAVRRRRKVRDVMVRHVVTIDAQASVLDAAQRMRDDNVGVLPIVDNDRIVGVVTDRDLVVRALARGADVSTTRVRDCASTTVVSARPHWSLDEALRVMGECRIGRLPVVDDDKTVIGMVTLSSLALRAPGDDETLQTAREVSRRSTRAA